MAEETKTQRTGLITFLTKFPGQVRSEARKVTWTSRAETLSATLMVVIMVVVASLFFLAADAISNILVQFITGIGGA